MLSESSLIQHSERVRAELETTAGEPRVKIRVESFDTRLGWYSSGSVTLGLDQLPLLEQAISEMRARERSRREQPCEIIPFPGLELSADETRTAE